MSSCILLRICVVCLAPSHKLLRESHREIKRVEFQLDWCSRVHGKRKNELFSFGVVHTTCMFTYTFTPCIAIGSCSISNMHGQLWYIFTELFPIITH